MPSRRATGSGSRSPRAIGPWHGPRPRPSRSPSSPAPASSSCRCARPRPEDAKLPAFPASEGAEPLAKTYHRPASGRRWIERDIGTGLQTFHVEEDLGHYTIDHIGLETDYVHREAYRIRDDDPLSAEIEISFVITIGRGDWKARSETWTVMRADKTDFHIEAKLNSFEGDKPVFSREWKERIPRDFN